MQEMEWIQAGRKIFLTIWNRGRVWNRDCIPNIWAIVRLRRALLFANQPMYKNSLNGFSPLAYFMRPTRTNAGKTEPLFRRSPTWNPINHSRNFVFPGQKDCDLPKSALTSIHSNSFSQGPNSAGSDTNGNGRLHVSSGLCDPHNLHQDQVKVCSIINIAHAYNRRHIFRRTDYAKRMNILILGNWICHIENWDWFERPLNWTGNNVHHVSKKCQQTDRIFKKSFPSVCHLSQMTERIELRSMCSNAWSRYLIS